MIPTFVSHYDSPIGLIAIVGTDDHVTAVTFSDVDAAGRNSNPVTEEASSQLGLYFKGMLRTFHFPMMQEGTVFQKSVWDRLNAIPYGTTTSYAAFSAEQPLAIRAIAAANGKNNIAIVVPCHRVIGSSGKLVGYAGGLWRKKWLLQHEVDVAGVGQAALKF